MSRYLLEEFTISNNGLQFCLSDSKVLESDKQFKEKSWWRGTTKMYVLSKLEISEVQNNKTRRRNEKK